MQYRSLTGRYNGRARSLQSEVQIGPAFDQGSVTADDARSCAHTYTGLWDTGATGCVVSQRVIDECGLVPIGMTKVYHADGDALSPVYRVSLFLPNRVASPEVRVTRGILSSCDVLIGMDVIGSGDFAVSSDHGRTVFSFRVPSAGAIDFVSMGSSAVLPGQQPGRNSPCPCGSGKRYKNCHGRRA